MKRLEPTPLSNSARSAPSSCNLNANFFSYFVPEDSCEMGISLQF